MKEWLAVFGVMAVTAACVTQAAEAPPSPYGAAAVAAFKKPPVVDGKIEPGEWDAAAGKLRLSLQGYGVRVVRLD